MTPQVGRDSDRASQDTHTDWNRVRAIVGDRGMGRTFEGQIYEDLGGRSQAPWCLMHWNAEEGLVGKVARSHSMSCWMDATSNIKNSQELE